MLGEIVFPAGGADIAIPVDAGPAPALVPGFSLGINVDEDDMFVKLTAQLNLDDAAAAELRAAFAVDGVAEAPLLREELLGGGVGRYFEFSRIVRLTRGYHTVQLHAANTVANLLEASAMQQRFSAERVSNHVMNAPGAKSKGVSGNY